MNLALEVLGKRDDGYHEIATVMQAVDLSDRLTLEAADTSRLRTSDSRRCPRTRRNLALRAARLLHEAAGVDRGARITLDKRIPVAAGLGRRIERRGGDARGAQPPVGAALAA